jgi:hypothetical protein
MRYLYTSTLFALGISMVLRRRLFAPRADSVAQTLDSTKHGSILSYFSVSSLCSLPDPACPSLAFVYLCARPRFVAVLRKEAPRDAA